MCRTLTGWYGGGTNPVIVEMVVVWLTGVIDVAEVEEETRGLSGTVQWKKINQLIQELKNLIDNLFKGPKTQPVFVMSVY